MSVVARATMFNIKVYDEYSEQVFLFFEVGLDMMDLEAMADALSEWGWEVVKPWADMSVGWEAEVERIPDVPPWRPNTPVPSDNNRRADLAVQLSEEDDREGEHRDILTRVESALEFEQAIRDRREFPD